MAWYEDLANWIGAGLSNPGQAIQDTAAQIQAAQYGFTGPNAVADYQAHLAKQAALEGPSNLPQWQQDFNKNPIVQTVAPFVGVNYGTSTGFNPGVSANQNPQGNLDTNAVADNAFATQNAANPSYSPQNPSSNPIGQTNYNFLTPTTNKVGYSPVQVNMPTDAAANPRPGDASGNLGLTPINTNTMGSASTGVSYGFSGGEQGNSAASTVNGSYINPSTAGASTPTNNSGFTQTAGGPSQVIDGLIAAAPAVAGVAAGVSTAINGQAAANAAEEAAKIQSDAAHEANLEAQRQFNIQQQNTQPYRDAAAPALQKLSTFDTDHPAFGMAQYQQDPGYSFRLSEGLKALQNSASARGMQLSGNTLTGINNYAQDSASQEYQNAFNRYQTTTGAQRAGLQSLAGLGQTAVGQANQSSQNYTNDNTALVTGGANAMAKGTTDAANINASSYDTGLQSGLNGIQSGVNTYQKNKIYNSMING